ncbi:MAG: CAAD domain-containing protein [Synechococcaceae cyanobacterium]|nr:CAAD domain-containing protein [Synechococcaceae cyanobacterium]
MVDSTLPPETPQNSAAEAQPGPEAAIPSATEATEPQVAEAPTAVPASTTPDPIPAGETTASATVVANSMGASPPAGAAAAIDPGAASTSSTEPSRSVLDPGAINPTPDAAPSAPSAPAAAPPLQESAPEPAAASTPEGVASTLSVPPLEGEARSAGEGGEFDLLISRVSAWLKEQNLPARWETLQGPLRAVALLLLALVLLRLYAALIDTLDSLPLVPRLLQLVGVIVLVKFSLTNLVRTSDRERLISSWTQRWTTFRGKV